VTAGKVNSAALTSLRKINVNVQPNAKIKHQLDRYDGERNWKTTNPCEPEKEHENTGQRIHLCRYTGKSQKP